MVTFEFAEVRRFGPQGFGFAALPDERVVFVRYEKGVRFMSQNGGAEYPAVRYDEPPERMPVEGDELLVAYEPGPKGLRAAMWGFRSDYRIAQEAMNRERFGNTFDVPWPVDDQARTRIQSRVLAQIARVEAEVAACKKSSRNWREDMNLALRGQEQTARLKELRKIAGYAGIGMRDPEPLLVAAVA